MTLLCGLLLSPLLGGIIGKVKALFGGRKGPPLLQVYFDIFKLFRKGVVYSSTTTGIFRIAPWVGLSSLLCSFLLLPVPGREALLPFPGDFFVLFAFLATMRFLWVTAALDTGSSFEGMGASREVFFAFWAEPALLVNMAVLAIGLRGYTLSDLLYYPYGLGPGKVIGLYFISISLFIVLLAENARIPFDDPNTHLELTMIHEVMILDHSGPELGCLLYSASLKLWVLGTLWVGITNPLRWGDKYLDLLTYVLGMGVLAVLVGIVESILARVRLVRVPQALTFATILGGLSLLWFMG